MQYPIALAQQEVRRLSQTQLPGAQTVEDIETVLPWNIDDQVMLWDRQPDAVERLPNCINPHWPICLGRIAKQEALPVDGERGKWHLLPLGYSSQSAGAAVKFQPFSKLAEKV